MSASRLRQRIDLGSLASRLGKDGGVRRIGEGDAAGERARIAGRLAASEMPRVRPLLVDENCGREVSAVLQLWRDASGLVVIDGAIDGDLPLLCQRCLENFDWQFGLSFQIALQDSESASRAHTDLEILDGIGDSIVPAELIEDEILLAMPLVPRHTSESDCGPLTSGLKHNLNVDLKEGLKEGLSVKGGAAAGGDNPDVAETSDMSKPFAGLAGLLPGTDKLD